MRCNRPRGPPARIGRVSTQHDGLKRENEALRAHGDPRRRHPAHRRKPPPRHRPARGPGCARWTALPLPILECHTAAAEAAHAHRAGMAKLLAGQRTRGAAGRRRRRGVPPPGFPVLFAGLSGAGKPTPADVLAAMPCDEPSPANSASREHCAFRRRSRAPGTNAPTDPATASALPIMPRATPGLPG